MAHPAETHYSTLGVPAAAGAAEIRAAYKSAAVTLHPDKGGDPQQWTALQSSYDILSDDARRARYDRLLAGQQGTGWVESTMDSGESVEERFVGGFRGGAAASSDGNSDGGGSGAVAAGLIGRIEQHIEQQEAEQRSRGAGAVVERRVNPMNHTDGFNAWLRNHQTNVSAPAGILTGDDLVRQGMIATTGVLDVSLPELRCAAVMYDEYGKPAEIARLCASVSVSKQRLEHGEVLVRMLAAPVNDEDLLRMSTPLHALNAMPPFDQPVMRASNM